MQVNDIVFSVGNSKNRAKIFSGENTVARSASQVKRVNRVCVVGIARSNTEVTDLLKVSLCFLAFWN